MNDERNQRPLWHDTVKAPRRWPTLTTSIRADVVIVGAGITGLSTAWHLVNNGVKVVVLEAGEVGRGTTGSSTGNLYVPTGPRLHAIEKKHGAEVVRAVATARAAAMGFIEARVKEQQVGCDFRRVPFHLFSAPDDEAAAEVKDEYATAQHLGLPVSNTIHARFPFRATSLMTLADQAQFNPLQYCLGLAAVLADKGCDIYENTRVLETTDGEPCNVATEHGKVTAHHIVKATHVPQGFYAVHAAMIPQREYAVLARIDGDLPPPAIYWNANQAWRYSVRPWSTIDGNYLMVLGEPHKPGEQKAVQLTRIHQFLREHFAVQELSYGWAAQNYQSADLLPYIGTSPLEKHTWMATGFAADGLVWGTLAGKLISDGIHAVDNPWSAFFSPQRFTPAASAKNFARETAAAVKHLLHDHTTYGRAKECKNLVRGEGRVIKFEGEKLAVCRDHEGALHVVSAVCTHLGCLVHWNEQELSWDCPCHGSRFSKDGRVLEGPAQSDLASAVPVNIDDAR